MLTAVLAGLTGVVAIANWIAVAQDRRKAEQWLKPGTLALLILAVVSAGALGHAAGIWLVVALLLGMAGDIALLDDRAQWRFVAGLTAFLLGHLAYLACFLAVGLSPQWRVLGGVAVVVVALAAARRVLSGAGEQGGRLLAAMVAVYMGVIAVMTITAWATGSWWIAAGASIFVASDTTLALNRFVRPFRHAGLVIMVTYHLGQALISVGVLLALR